MINIYDWSYDIEKNLVRIAFNQPLANKIILVANSFKAQLISNIKCEDNELYFGLKNALVANDFVTALIEKYPNSFTLKNKWDISQTANTTVSFSCIVDSNLNDVEGIVITMFDDFKTINSLTNKKVSNFELNIDSSVGYMNFDIVFSTQDSAKNFIHDYNRFKK
ncbi:MAG: hypothetical protein K6B70_07660 [Clostridia bacterium]|nr:hypothetical protein [Clostridia bacterium]